ncbi:unnamed protein product [Sphagnum balticum]
MVAKDLSSSGIPDTSKARKERSEMEADAKSQPPPKRQRGRPRKSEVVTPGMESSGEGITPQKSTPTKSVEASTPKKSDDAKPKRIRKKKGELAAASIVDATLIGQPVTGVLDGSFDAGYLLSVRVGNTDTILHGAVFGPGLSLPISKVNDIAPAVRFVMRHEMIPQPQAPAVPGAPLVPSSLSTGLAVPGSAAVVLPNATVPSASAVPSVLQ